MAVFLSVGRDLPCRSSSDGTNIFLPERAVKKRVARSSGVAKVAPRSGRHAKLRSPSRLLRDSAELLTDVISRRDALEVIDRLSGVSLSVRASRKPCVAPHAGRWGLKLSVLLSGAEVE